jgi:hypothetical protein
MAVSFWLSFYSGCGLKSGLEDQFAFIAVVAECVPAHTRAFLMQKLVF